MFDTEKKIFKNVHWSIFVLAGGFLWALYIFLMNTIGSTISILGTIFLVVLIVSLVQVVVGVLFTARSGFLFFPGQRPVIGSILLGILNAYSVVVILYLFGIYELSVVTVAFFVALTLFPQVMIERILSRKTGNVITAFILIFVGLYAIVMEVGGGFPNLNWLWLALTLPIASIVGEVINRKIGSSASFSQWVHHLWSGIPAFLIASMFLLYSYRLSIAEVLRTIDSSLLLLSATAGISIVVFMFVRGRAYMAGGDIVQKKFFILILFLTLLLVSSVISGSLAIGGFIATVSLLFSFLVLLK